MNEVEAALHSIRVEHDEDLVVPFGASGGGSVSQQSSLISSD